ncbi:MAG: hypothetical protein ACI4TW_07385, partial [Prevotella sp.]
MRKQTLIFILLFAFIFMGAAVPSALFESITEGTENTDSVSPNKDEKRGESIIIKADSLKKDSSATAFFMPDSVVPDSIVLDSLLADSLKKAVPTGPDTTKMDS